MAQYNVALSYLFNLYTYLIIFYPLFAYNHLVFLMNHFS